MKRIMTLSFLLLPLLANAFTAAQEDAIVKKAETNCPSAAWDMERHTRTNQTPVEGDINDDRRHCLEEYARSAPERAAAAKQEAKPAPQLGMTTKQVRNGTSWGAPAYINRTGTAYGIHEQWVYGSRHYLYFTNGILTSWQD